MRDAILLAVTASLVAALVHAVVRGPGPAVTLSIYLTPVAFVAVLALTDLWWAETPLDVPRLLWKALHALLAAIPATILYRMLSGRTARDMGRNPDTGMPCCRNCHYLLIGLSERRCPECGLAFTEEDLRTARIDDC